MNTYIIYACVVGAALPHSLSSTPRQTHRESGIHEFIHIIHHIHSQNKQNDLFVADDGVLGFDQPQLCDDGVDNEGLLFIG